MLGELAFNSERNKLIKDFYCKIYVKMEDKAIHQIKTMTYTLTKSNRRTNEIASKIIFRWQNRYEITLRTKNDLLISLKRSYLHISKSF